MPILATALTAALGIGWKWLATRASMEDVAAKVAEVSIAAKAAQSSALTCETDAKQQALQLHELSVMALETWSQQEVERQYSKSPRKSEYMDRARRFYQREYETQLLTHANNPAEALRLTMLAVWRPDREGN
jgi:hypothetical protein